MKLWQMSLCFFLLGCITLNGHAALYKLSEETLADSEEPFDRRIYSYDFDVDTKDWIVHAIFAKPVQGDTRAQIVYVTKKAQEQWDMNKAIVLEEYGFISSISTAIVVDDTGVAHVSYVVAREIKDSNGTAHQHGLVYQTVNKNVPSEKKLVSSGAFNSKMQLNENTQPIFVREYEIFTYDGVKVIDPPFPKALRIQVPSGKSFEELTWTDREHVLRLPSPTDAAEDYRLANFLYDKNTKRYHILYGDKHAAYLRDAYPTCNPPVPQGKRCVAFPNGAGHKLWYGYSDDLKTWQTSLADDSGNLAENEFWTDLILNNQGQPMATSFRYVTDEQGIHRGSTGMIAKFNANINQWSMQTVAGKTSGRAPLDKPRAGMGAKLVTDSGGGIHGVWDNSPDEPIDSESGQAEAGTMMYHYSPDGQAFDTRQMLLPYSVEGLVKLKVLYNQLLVMALVDARDSRLVFANFHIPLPTDNLFEVSTDKMFYSPGENVQFHVRFQGTGNIKGDIYLIAKGPQDVDSSGQLMPISGVTRLSYLSFSNDAFQWQAINQLSEAKPVLADLPSMNFSGYFMVNPANKELPFNGSARYQFLSIFNKSGEPLTEDNSPPLLYPKKYDYRLHVW